MKITRKPTFAQKAKTDKTHASHKRGNLGYGKYILPLDGNIPADLYYSEIKHIVNSTTRGGEDAITVYYKMAKFSDVFQKANNITAADKTLDIRYIKQIYPLTSEAYDRFLETMYDYLELDYSEKLDMKRCIGLTEKISIGYVSKSGFGSIVDRWYWDDECFVELYQHQCRLASEDVELDEYGNVI